MTLQDTLQNGTKPGLNLDRLGLGLLAAVLIAAPLLLSNAYQLNVLVLMVVNAVLAIGLAIVIRAGRLSLAQASFGGIGGYTTGFLTTTQGLSFWLALPVCGLIAMVVGILFAKSGVGFGFGFTPAWLVVPISLMIACRSCSTCGFRGSGMTV